MNINYPHYTITTRYNICLLHKYSFVILFVILVKYCLLYKYKYLFVIDMYTCTCRNPNNQNKYYIEYNIDIIILHPLLLMNGWTNCVIIYCCLLYKLFGHNNSSLNYELMKLGGRAISAPPIRRWTTECRAISAPFPIFELWRKNNEAGNFLNVVEREPVETRVLNPTASEASYKPKQRSYRTTNLKKKVLAPNGPGAKTYPTLYHSYGRFEILSTSACSLNLTIQTGQKLSIRFI